MNFSVEQVEAAVPVTVMGLEGELDASCYLDVIERAKSLYEAGTRNLLLDLSGMSFMGSSGLVSLHSVALIMRGQQPPDPGSGWSAFHAIADDLERGTGHEVHCKLLNPQPRVVKTLTTAGFDKLLAVYTDRQTALESFSA
jgi:anti-anti-sigma regulatory factor